MPAGQQAMRFKSPLPLGRRLPEDTEPASSSADFSGNSGNGGD